MNAFPQRLKSARKMKGWSLQQLADSIGITITKQALHKYEAGEMKPSGSVLIALSKALDLKPDYFLREPTVELPAVEFRKRTRLSAKEEESIKERVKEFLERYLEVESLLGIHSEFINPIGALKICSDKDIEDAVLQIIAAWNIGFDPIHSVIDMLEENGVRVVEIDAPETFDGMCTNVGTIPVIVINKNYSVERKRFTALHELGHHLLNLKAGVDKEKACHRFAGAMLLPGDVLPDILGEKRNNIAIGELVSIKEQYGISVQATMMRAIQKGIIEKGRAERFWRAMSQNRKEEGLGAYAGKEKSYRFEHLVFRLAAEEVVSMSKAANLAGLRMAAFRDRLEAM